MTATARENILALRHLPSAPPVRRRGLAPDPAFGAPGAAPRTVVVGMGASRRAVVAADEPEGADAATGHADHSPPRAARYGANWRRREALRERGFGRRTARAALPPRGEDRDGAGGFTTETVGAAAARRAAVMAVLADAPGAGTPEIATALADEPPNLVRQALDRLESVGAVRRLAASPGRALRWEVADATAAALIETGARAAATAARRTAIARWLAAHGPAFPADIRAGAAPEAADATVREDLWRLRIAGLARTEGGEEAPRGRALRWEAGNATEFAGEGAAPRDAPPVAGLSGAAARALTLLRALRPGEEIEGIKIARLLHLRNGDTHLALNELRDRGLAAPNLAMPGVWRLAEAAS